MQVCFFKLFIFSSDKAAMTDFNKFVVKPEEFCNERLLHKFAVIISITTYGGTRAETSFVNISRIWEKKFEFYP